MTENKILDSIDVVDRKQFEAWARRYDMHMARTMDGLMYIDRETHIAWIAWVAALDYERHL